MHLRQAMAATLLAVLAGASGMCTYNIDRPRDAAEPPAAVLPSSSGVQPADQDDLEERQ